MSDEPPIKQFTHSPRSSHVWLAGCFSGARRGLYGATPQKTGIRLPDVQGCRQGNTARPVCCNFGPGRRSCRVPASGAWAAPKRKSIAFSATRQPKASKTRAPIRHKSFTFRRHWWPTFCRVPLRRRAAAAMREAFTPTNPTLHKFVVHRRPKRPGPPWHRQPLPTRTARQKGGQAR